MKQKIKSYLGNVSPWIIIGASAILVVVILTLAVMNYSHGKKYTVKILSEKGTALIRSFEAATRTGMMGWMGQEADIQRLIDETSELPDILYITIVDEKGIVLASSHKNLIGKKLLPALALKRLKASNTTKWRIIRPDKSGAFEVYKNFTPVKSNTVSHNQRESMHHMGMMRGRGRWDRNGFFPGHRWQSNKSNISSSQNKNIIFIGMDLQPFKKAVSEDISMTMTMSGTLLLLGLGGFVSLFWMNSHLRSRKLLQDSRAITEEIVENLPEAIIACSQQGEVIFINPAARQMLARDVFRPGRTAAEILPQKIVELGEKVMGEGTPIINREMNLKALSNREFPVSINISSIVTSENESIGMMYMIRDMTEVRRLQNRIRKADKLATIGQLAAGVAHEVRNPLSSIKGYATYFGSLFPEGSENRKASEVMTSEVDRLNRVISELLEMARPADLKIKETEVAALIESSLRLVRQEAQSASVKIETHQDGNVSKVKVDPDRLAQTLINLYVNAIQAMPDGGTLSVSTEQKDDQLFIAVSDTGQGLPEGDLGRIFNPYYTTKPSGTGLGLAIVQKIVEAHDGRIEIEKTGPEGTTFKITIPLTTDNREK
ncbi:ATP-binding protein [Maridesulfovibrio bastinii]|uniref:ATP-binding protein n=1 Tax=Maridesulfovibrio bastinii TaxID=47157 RepID=UPI0003F61176|nr:ATP-binding protein [Maridesulfovibrio bastinii]